MEYSYKHHIIPLHEWKRRINPKAKRNDKDFNASDNIVWLSLEQHIHAHRLLFELNGNHWDRLAYRGLAGIISHEEVVKEMSGLANRGKHHTEEWKQDNSERMKFLWEVSDRKDNHIKRMKGNQYTLGRKRPIEERKKIGLSMIGRPGHRSTVEESIAQSVRQAGKKRGPYKTKNT